MADQLFVLLSDGKTLSPVGYAPANGSNPANPALPVNIVGGGSGGGQTSPIEVSGQSVNVTVNPPVTAGAYSAGNVVGGLLTFANVTRATILSGILNSIRVSCKSVQTTGFKLYIFGSNPTNSTWTDKAAPSINAADIPFLVGEYTLGPADSGLGTHTIYNLDGVGKVISPPTGTMYGVLVCVGTPTLGSTSDVFVSVGVVQD